MAHALRRGAQAAAACAVCGLLGALWGTSDWAPALIPTSRGTPRRASAPPAPAAAPALASLVPVVEDASAPARTTGRLVGRVLDEDRRPLGGAELLLLRRGGGALTLPPTAPDGGFAASLDPGDYVLGVEVDGAAPAGFELVDAEDQRLETVRVTSGATCTLEVRAHLAHAVQVAVLGAGGEPIPRASVTLEGDPSTYLRRGPARTDAGG
ncbi:MAG: carboxypeptidase-like regulatory domain-containing protein, partial [Planctomycetota bacterium]